MSTQDSTTVTVDQEDYIQARVANEVEDDFVLHNFLAEAVLKECGMPLDEFTIEHEVVEVAPEGKFLLRVSWEEI